MMLMSRRSLLAIAAVVDVALNARPAPVAAKTLAERNGLSPRRLEPLLQALVREGILKSSRGPHGGYELARDRRRINAADVVRAAMTIHDDDLSEPLSPLAETVISPCVDKAMEAFLATLQEVTVADLCERSHSTGLSGGRSSTSDFTI